VKITLPSIFYLLHIEFIFRHKPEFTEEEKAVHHIIGAEFYRQSTRRSNLQNKDLATKCWLQGEAIRSLRPDLKEQAEICDEEPPPFDRPWPFWNTPPIKGFNARDYMKKSDDDDDENDDK
jgi:hypothetical protein